MQELKTIKARPLTLADFEDGTVVEGMEVYWRREHAGDITWDPATLKNVVLPKINDDEPTHWTTLTPTGDGRWFTVRGSVTVQSVYGMMVTFAPHQTSDDVYVADTEGEEIPLTPVYGAAATLTITMPGIDPEVLEEALGSFLQNFSDRARVTSMTTKPLADRRINVYENNGAVKGAPIALNILEGEGHAYYGQACFVGEVSRAEFERNMALLREAVGDKF
jgi:hypothetical protein